MKRCIVVGKDRVHYIPFRPGHERLLQKLYSIPSGSSLECVPFALNIEPFRIGVATLKWEELEQGVEECEDGTLNFIYDPQRTGITLEARPVSACTCITLKALMDLLV